ncbi:MAG TPA: CsgG/HfaB family protein [Polyangiales bacterium]|nr:CsgG/HfaB family protein [Polyangiales bacterium]
MRLSIGCAAVWIAVFGCALSASAQPARLPVTVAVMYFDYSGQDAELSSLSKGLAQLLITDLGSVSQLQLVERTRLEEVVSELKLARSAQVDPATRARLGRLLGARYLVLGSYFAVSGKLRADARVVEVETGRVLRSVGATGKTDDVFELEQTLVKGLSEALSAQVPSRAAPPAPARPAPKRPAKLRVKTAAEYGRALDAIDRGDRADARDRLNKVLKDQPDFRLAKLQLEDLAK